MKLHDVNEGITKYKKRRRIGRGPGSGHGKTAGKGHKGQKSRSGWSQKVTFQGGAMAMVRRIPKRGFNNRFALDVATLNLRDLERVFNDGDEVTPKSIKQQGLLTSRYDVLKILGDGELGKKLNVPAHRFSAKAQEQIEAAGGTVTVLPGKAPVVENKMKPKTPKSRD